MLDGEDRALAQHLPLARGVFSLCRCCSRSLPSTHEVVGGEPRRTPVERCDALHHCDGIRVPAKSDEEARGLLEREHEEADRPEKQGHSS